jgi:hypothetical protein
MRARDHFLRRYLNPATTRTIALDVRYMLWEMEIVDNATNVLNELRGK